MQMDAGPFFIGPKQIYYIGKRFRGQADSHGAEAASDHFQNKLLFLN